MPHDVTISAGNRQGQNAADGYAVCMDRKRDLWCSNARRCLTVVPGHPCGGDRRQFPGVTL